MKDNIESISFRVGGFFGYDNFNIVIAKDGTAHFSHEAVSGRSVLPNDIAFSRTETKQFLKAFEQTGVFSWERNYHPDWLVTDGIQWIVEINRKGKRKLIREGDNQFPPHWGSFCKLFGIYSEDVKTVMLQLHMNQTFVPSKADHYTDLFRWSEKISIDLDAGSVKAERLKGNHVVIQSEVFAESEAFETLNEDLLRTLTYEWFDVPQQPNTPDVPFYELIVTRFDGTVETHEGVYDKNHVPEDWQDVMGDIHSLVPQGNKYLLLDNKKFYSVKGEFDRTFYSVEVFGFDRSYYYFSHDDTLKIGESVLVPFGKDNELQIGTIQKIEYFSPDELPFPVEKTKYIERRLEPGETLPEKTVHCPVINDEITGTDCMTISDVADRLLSPNELWDEVTWNEEQRSRCLACQWHYGKYNRAKSKPCESENSKIAFTEQDVIDAHKFSSSNMPELAKGEKCGCFYCGKIFDSKEITRYLIDDNDCDRDGTACCPYCDIDSVIGESSGYPITTEFLYAMKKEWF